MRLRFSKMHGLGNDFIVIDGISQSVRLTPEKIRFLSDRHFGVGCDQLLLVEHPENPAVDFRYRIFNCDGTEVENCGNGARCFAVFVRERRLTGKRRIKVETAGGIIELHADTRQHRHIIRMGSVSRPRWIIRNFISTLSRSTLPLLANNPAPWSPKPALDATGSALHHGVAHCPQTPAWDAAGALVANAPMSSLPRPARPQVGARSPWGHLTSPPLPACTSLKTSASGS